MAKAETKVALYTDYRKAFVNHFYGERVLIDSFQGATKITTAIEKLKTDLIFEEKIFKKTIIAEIEGAVLNGYDSSLVSGKFQGGVGCFLEIDELSQTMLESHSLTATEIKHIKTQLLSLTEPLDMDDLE